LTACASDVNSDDITDDISVDFDRRQTAVESNVSFFVRLSSVVYVNARVGARVKRYRQRPEHG
jgi:hypothetical protein